MTGSFQFSLLFSCMKGIYILLLNKAYSQLTLGYSRTTALILVTAPILFIYSVECHRGVAPVPPQTFVYKSLTKNVIFLPAILSLRRSRTVSSFKLASLRRRRTVRGFNPPPRADLTQARNSVQAQLVNVLLFTKTGLVFIAPENVASFHSPTSECVNTSDCRVLKVQLSA